MEDIFSEFERFITEQMHKEEPIFKQEENGEWVYGIKGLIKI